MEYVMLLLNSNRGNYFYKDASNIEMTILGDFLTSDVGCHSYSSFKDWILNNAQIEASSNATHMEKKGDYIFLSDIYPVMEKPKKLKMSCAQLVQLLDDWKKSVCDRKPKEVTIKHENNHFVIETKD